MKALITTFATLLLCTGLMAQTIPEWKAPDHNTVAALTAPQPVNLEAIKAEVVYPEHALDAWMEGPVVVRVLVDQEGRYIRHRIISTPSKTLANAVYDVLPKIEFTPAHVDGRTMPGWTHVTFNFKMQR